MSCGVTTGAAKASQGQLLCQLAPSTWLLGCTLFSLDSAEAMILGMCESQYNIEDTFSLSGCTRVCLAPAPWQKGLRRS